MGSLEELLESHLKSPEAKAEPTGAGQFEIVARLDVDDCTYFLIKSPRAAPADLSSTERSIAQLVSSGLSNKQVAARLSLSQNTVRVYLHRIFKKLNVESRTELARYFAINYPMDFFFMQ